ncbi:hypothetical protein DFJ58DRAFT_840011 [Suillus subalutaceus]|uniref:uncharacterized protein n=1 Tax=Suillus subalutaceus TaxID=48586 RepID=UPI001B873AAE|nr:uncharacterized protein DFJ58DRAFT_840011 [Suillus subalutaceus]KAG1860332.1 hypothetical protein DFJ58DRAFT_840011 [Suillus subalutaceus]
MPCRRRMLRITWFCTCCNMRYPQGLNVCISVSQLYPEFNSKLSAIMPSAHHCAATIESSLGTDPEFSSDSDSDDSDAELIQVRAALAPAPPDATSQELRRALEISQRLLLDLCARTCPDIDLNSKERWLTGVSMEDGVRAELFKFIPEEERELMSYQNFGSQFGRGVSNAHSKMASDVKSCANLIIQYPSVVENCKARAGVLKVSLFSKSSLAPTGAASSRTKAKIWKLRAITPGMIAAAAVVAIFLLSGDAELTEIGDTTKIPYREYHNFYRQRLLTGGAWAHQVITFFNDALFSGTSSYVPPSTALNDDGLGHTWEEDFNRAIEDELEEPVVDDGTPPIPSRHANDNTNSGNVQVNELLPVSHHTSAPSIPAPSISAPPQAVAAPPIAAPPVVTAPPVINMARSSESITTAWMNSILGIRILLNLTFLLQLKHAQNRRQAQRQDNCGG